MDSVQTLIKRSCVHPEWQLLLTEALSTLDGDYTQRLIKDSSWLPGIDNLLAAFRRNRKDVRYLLIGESPYPRQMSANGIAFYDAAVGDLWSENGLSKAVNRATSMRNILKTALRAEGRVLLDDNGKITQENIAQVDKRELVQTMAELFDNLHRRGFLMLNATPVLHPERKPAKEALFWKDFLQKLLALLADSLNQTVTLVLWGKIAENIEALPAASQYQKLVCEHPYNISFIDNPTMLDFFGDLKILRRD
jgi:uracil-DNA glycosylase